MNLSMAEHRWLMGLLVRREVCLARADHVSGFDHGAAGSAH